MELKDQIAIVTGAGRGIGEAIAMTFAREGAHVVVADINLDDAGKVSQKIISMGRRSIPVKADVSSRSQVESMVNEAVKEFGTIDILVNNAGIGGSSRLVKDMPEESWDQVMAINLKGVFLCCRAVVPIMIEKGRGKIVNIASLAARRMSFLGGADYTASKYGVLGLSHHLAYELAVNRINVNVVCPGATLTKLTDEKAPQEVKEKVAENVPLGRWCTPQDQADAVFFLVSERAKMITGHVIDVDGGQLLGFGNYPEEIERRVKASSHP
jgi:NAD(P)-dependent dehydrogenase (short-subunit alcohol dehydrogenase family)